jgi:hypothetical protein
MEQFHLRKIAFQIVQQFQNAPLRVNDVTRTIFDGEDLTT